ncbi:hypothetical protein N665_1145s0015 [Sinapis alba]|nr:hypothetical protein N665_1145s0015 [Sinapis alba]
MAVYYPTSVGMQSLYQEPIYLNEASSSSAASFSGAGAGVNCLETPISVPNEMVFIPPTSDTSLINGNVTVSSNDLSFHGGGLSLSLGNQIQYHYQNLSNQLSYNNHQNPSLSDDNGKSFPSSGYSNGVGFYNNGFVSSVLRSRYLKPTQQLLDEVVSVKKTKKDDKGQDFTNGSKSNDNNNNNNNTENNEELSPSERQELQGKKNKLLTMVDEVDKRYNQYYHQMEALASSFEMVAGHGAAKPYTSVALNRISRHFRCLRDAIKEQVQVIRGKLGEKESCEEQGERIPRLRYLDQRLRQQRALHQQLGMVRPTWRPQRGLPENSVSILRAWLFEHFLHPYPKESEKIMLAKQTGLSKNQRLRLVLSSSLFFLSYLLCRVEFVLLRRRRVVVLVPLLYIPYTSDAEENLIFADPKPDSLMNYNGFGVGDYNGYIGLGNQQDGRFSNPHQLHDFVV